MQEAEVRCSTFCWVCQCLSCLQEVDEQGDGEEATAAVRKARASRKRKAGAARFEAECLGRDHWEECTGDFQLFSQFLQSLANTLQLPACSPLLLQTSPSSLSTQGSPDAGTVPQLHLFVRRGTDSGLAVSRSPGYSGPFDQTECSHQLGGSLAFGHLCNGLTRAATSAK